jgi:hypothetical protein
LKLIESPRRISILLLPNRQAAYVFSVHSFFYTVEIKLHWIFKSGMWKFACYYSYYCMIYFSGKTELELPETRKRMRDKASFVNIYPFVWKEFQENGYVTGESNHLSSLSHTFPYFILKARFIFQFCFLSLSPLLWLMYLLASFHVTLYRFVADVQTKSFWCHCILNSFISPSL